MIFLCITKDSNYTICFSLYDELHRQLVMVTKLKQIAAGCRKPCHYKQYKLVGEKYKTHNIRNSSLTFSLWAYDNDIYLETEYLVYPWTSLVAEFGGTLSLFLGFSFMMIWDGMEKMCTWRLMLNV